MKISTENIKIKQGNEWVTIPAFGGYASAEIIQKVSYSDFPRVGATNALYIALNTKKIYYWDGNEYVVATSGGSVLEHSLTIGHYIFDGSEDVNIEIYDGNVDDLKYQTRTMLMTNEDNQMILVSNTYNMTTDSPSMQMMKIEE